MSATPGRVAALDALRAVRRGDLVDRVLARRLDQVPARDRAWTQELVYGTLRLRGRLDDLLSRLVRQPLNGLEPDVLDILRLGAYQLLEMGGVPAYAAVSQSVELAKAASGRGAGRLVNGVLQSLRRSMGGLTYPTPEDDPVAHLTSWGSHPQWLVERWIERFGVDETIALVAANNTRPELYLRPLGVTVSEAGELLQAAGIESSPVPLAPDALRIAVASNLPRALRVVPGIVQDPAGTLVVRYAAAPAGARIADVAAAPGGKALALAAPGGDTSPRFVVASDVSLARVARLEENAARIAALPLRIVVADLRETPLRAAAFDLVLLDAPCTGTGTFRRHPDGRWRIGKRDLDALVELQRTLLAAAAALVRPGGFLIYATCSLEPEENEQQVQTFLETHTHFTIAPPPRGSVEDRFVQGSGMLFVTPQTSGFDGAFAARLHRS